MPLTQPSLSAPAFHVSTSGCLVDGARWAQRKAEAAELVERRFLTLREASEHFGLPVEEIVGTRH